jgi:hypothetical protein
MFDENQGFGAALDGISLDGWVDENPDGSKTLTLEHPPRSGRKVNGRDAPRSVITLNRPHGGALDCLDVARPGMREMRQLCAAIAADGVTEREIAGLDLADFLRLLKLATGFLGDLLGTGAPSPPT